MNETSRRELLGGLAVGASALMAAQKTGAAEIQPSRAPGVGGTDPGPKDLVRERQNPDIVNPPRTDHGTLPNLRFSFADSHVRQESGGWTRQITERELGVSKPIAGVNMRLNAGGIRELHWHKEAEWAYMLYGTARINAIDPQGRNFVEDVGVGDLWYFPSGIPHAIQGLGPDGCEFLLVFDSGSFDEDSTFLLSDWFKHTPNEVLAKNFGVPGDLLSHTPDPSQLYIFDAPVPGPLGPDKLRGAEPVPNSFAHKMLAQEPIRTKSGTVRIVDFEQLSRVQDDRRGARRGRPGRHARTPLAPQRRRMAILHRGRGTDDRLRVVRSGAHLRLSRGRRRLCALRHGPLYREHRLDAAALPRNVQEQLLRGPVAQSMARLDAAGVAAGASASRSARSGRAAEDKGAHRPGMRSGGGRYPTMRANASSMGASSSARAAAAT